MDGTLSTQDRIFLRRSVEIGRRGWGRVHPNPTVGCILVRDGKVVGEAWHEEVGGPHAEVLALDAAGESARGATAYVSLEPCHHFGRTPPCSSALLEAGVARVVYGAQDPGKESSGGGGALSAGGIEVVGPVFTLEEARRENPAFFFNAEHQATYVALKIAQTLDGRIAAERGRRTTITGSDARRETHRLRAGFDGVMVGSGTVRTDDPFLTVREDVSIRSQPTRVILDTHAEVSPEAKLFQDLPEAPLLIVTGRTAPENRVERLAAAGATVRRVTSGPSGLPLRGVFDLLWSEGIRSLLCEGGSRLGSSLLREGIAQRLYLFVAPFVLGERGVPAFVGLDAQKAWESWHPAAPPGLFGRDVLLTFDRAE